MLPSRLVWNILYSEYIQYMVVREDVEWTERLKSGWSEKIYPRFYPMIWWQMCITEHQTDIKYDKYALIEEKVHIKACGHR